MVLYVSKKGSHPVRRSEKMSLILAERPANGGLLRIGGLSLDSEFGQFRSKIADSLRQTFEKLPFLGDWGWRPGSICTAWPELAVHLLKCRGHPPIGNGA